MSKLTKPALVGNTRFGVGVEERLVIERAQREYEYQVTPEREADRIARCRTFAELLGAGVGPLPDGAVINPAYPSFKAMVKDAVDACRYRWLRRQYALGQHTYLAEGITSEKEVDVYIDHEMTQPEKWLSPPDMAARDTDTGNPKGTPAVAIDSLMVCKKCGADRSKEPCRNRQGVVDCAMTGAPFK